MPFTATMFSIDLTQRVGLAYIRCIYADCGSSTEMSQDVKADHRQQWGSIMARPIEATPVLKGKDAKVFLEQTKIKEPISVERMLWLATLVKEGKAAEK